MITYAEREIFTTRHTSAYWKAVAYVDRIAHHWRNSLRCHELARAVMRAAFWDAGAAWGLTVVDGKCGPVEHSWLQFDDGVVLDVYAPGRKPAVQLVDLIVGYYKSDEPRTDIRESVVNQLMHEMR